MIRVKQKDLDYKSGLGYQRFKEIEENKKALENQQKLNKAVDYILSKQGIKKPTIVEKHEAMRKVFDKSAKELKQRQNMQMQKVSRKMDKQMKLITSMYARNKLNELKPKIKESSVKQMASLASPMQSGEATLPKAILPPTTIPYGIVQNRVSEMEKLVKKGGRPSQQVMAQRQGQKQEKKILDFMASNPSPSTPPSMTKIK
jgi:hypothetical protein